MDFSRPLVSYDDISAPGPSRPPPEDSPPAKRRRGNGPPESAKPRHAHWDDLGYDDAEVGYEESPVSLIQPKVEPAQPKVEQKHRELTHGEIWDDSALLDAWNAATEEYESFHGEGKDWKSEPTQKSALWYNTPYVPEERTTAVHLADERMADLEEEPSTETNSIPLDFNTFVPTHNTILITSPPRPAAEAATTYDHPILPPSGRDEAFQKAMTASYWSGYWTAMHQAKSQTAAA